MRTVLGLGASKLLSSCVLKYRNLSSCYIESASTYSGTFFGMVLSASDSLGLDEGELSASASALG